MMTRLSLEVLLMIIMMQTLFVHSLKQTSSSTITTVSTISIIATDNNYNKHMLSRRIGRVNQQIGTSSSSSSLNRIIQNPRSRDTSLMLTPTPVIEAFSAAFVGGTVGVMGMAFIVETRKLQDESLDMCPYCMGSGEILCGECLGSGEAMDAVNGNIVQCCSCQGRKQVLCINCKGDGRNTPIILQSRSARDPDYAVAGKLNEFDLDSP